MLDILAIDIETYPNPDMISKLPEVVADSRLKDEAKIKADIEKKKAEQIEKMALSPLYGKIACIGYYGEKYKEVDIQKSEADMIKLLLERAKDTTLFTWNGSGFDFDFIIKRGIMHGVCKLSDLKYFTSRYSANAPRIAHIDLMQEWCGYGKYAKLDDVASVVLGGECKEEFDVRQIPQLIKTQTGKELIRRYCLQDCKLVYDLARKFGF